VEQDLVTSNLILSVLDIRKHPIRFGNSAENRPTPTAASAQNRQGQTEGYLSVSGLYVVFEIEVV
jgi:hypothetical protein